MKTINVSDEDFKILMELSKELQTQDNNGQAFPYFWEPSSTTRERNFHGEGEFKVIWDSMNCCNTTAKDLKEESPEMWKSFLELNDLVGEDVDFDDVEDDWINFIDEDVDYETFTEDKVIKQEHNPSLFCSDVKDFIEYNSHHLDENPHTYSRSIWRMPKMISLVGAILRMNKDHGEEVNHEAARFLKD